MSGRHVVAAAACALLVLNGPLSASGREGATVIRGAVASDFSGEGVTSRVSVSPTGQSTNRWSTRPALSANGRSVAFYSRATNLVRHDTNSQMDVFVRNLASDVTQRVSVSSAGVQGDAQSYDPAISANGRYVTFTSYASNLVPRDTNDAADVFVRDLATGTTRRVSVPSGGAQSEGGDSYEPAISANGRLIAFVSNASDMVPGPITDVFNVYIRDRLTGHTRRVSISPTGAGGNGDSSAPAFSGHGQQLAFLSFASNLVPGDTNADRDVFVRDRTNGTTQRVSVSSSGVEADADSYEPAISTFGRYVVFSSSASNLIVDDSNSETDIFVHDVQTGTTHRLSVDSSGAQSDAESFAPEISALGQYVTYYSYASNLVDDDTNDSADVFERDRSTRTTTRLSVDSSGAQANEGSYEPAISADGSRVAFESLASNLVSADENDRTDVFVRDLD